MARRSALALLTLLVLLPGTASAAEVRLASAGRGPSYEVRFTAESGEANRLKATQVDGRTVRIEDSGATLKGDAACTPDGAAVVCRVGPAASDPQVSVVADLGDGDDETVTPIHGDVKGGPGNDVIAADGLLDGGPGADRMTGTGDSRLGFADRSAGVNVSFDGEANDGEPGEGDDVRGTFAEIWGGPGNDVIQTSGLPTNTSRPHSSVVGLEGDDRLIGSAGDDRLDGGEGADVLEGGPGDDTLLGGNAVFYIETDQDADRTRGGTGTDTWDSGVPGSSSRSWTPEDPPPPNLTISPDDVANDGVPGEGDDVGSDIENFRTSAGNDHITGTDAANVIESDIGDDTIVALGGADRIVAGAGSKRIDAGIGTDLVEIAAGNDDALLLRDDERDAASCAPGELASIDSDSIDELVSCVVVPRLATGSLGLRLSKRGSTAVRARCPRFAGVSCRGDLELYERGSTRLLAQGAYAIRRGAKEDVRVRLTSAGRKRLRARSSIPFVATASPSGHSLPPTAAHARGRLLRAR